MGNKKSKAERQMAQADFLNRRKVKDQMREENRTPAAHIQMAAAFALESCADTAAAKTMMKPGVLRKIATGSFDASVNQATLIIGVAKEIGWTPPAVK